MAQSSNFDNITSICINTLYNIQSSIYIYIYNDKIFNLVILIFYFMLHSRGRSHLKINFTPRSLMKANIKPQSKTPTNDETLPKQKMSNSDFRNFLLKK